MSTVKFSQIPVGYSNIEDVILTGVEKKTNASDEVTYENINIYASELIGESASSYITNVYNINDQKKALSSYGLANSFITTTFNTTDSIHALSGKALDFFKKEESSFSIKFKDLTNNNLYFNISEGRTIDGDTVFTLSVTNDTQTLSSVDLEDLVILSNFGFVSEVATELNSNVSNFIDDKIKHFLQSSTKYIELTETTDCKNNSYYIASTDNTSLYKSNTFNLSRVTFGSNSLSISKSYIFFVINKNVSIIFPNNLKWIDTSAPDQAPTFVTGNRYLVEIYNDGYGIIGKVLYGTPIE